MPGIHTQTVTAAHAYTRVDVPWEMDAAGIVARDRLIHYLSGGGMSTFGRTIRQQKARQRQLRFLVWVGAIMSVWTLFYIF